MRSSFGEYSPNEHHLYPVNPRTVAKYREAFKPSCAKDDPTDAALLEEILRQHRNHLRAWEPQSAELRMLGQLVESRRTLVEEKVRLSNRIIAALKNYFPQVLDWFADRDTQVFCDFITQYPTLKASQAAAPEELTMFFHQHKVVRKATIARRLKQIQTGVTLTEDPGVVEPLQLLVETWVQQLKLLLPSIQTFDAKIREIFAAHPDANIMVSFPGAGSHLAPRMLAALGEDRRRYSGSQDLQCYCGVAPVKDKRGKKEWIHWRLSCSKLLRQTFIEWANRSRSFSFWASEFYDRQRQAGKTHQMAIRSLAFKWIRILFRCWQERQPYDEAKYLMALKKKGSPLVKNLNVEKT